MPLSALLLALAAAVIHALWNVLLARAHDPEAATAVALVVAIVVFAPVAVIVWDVELAAWPYLVVTAALQLVYFVLLIAAYRRAELSVVYPIARGIAPVLVLATGVAALGAGTSPAQVVGVLLVGAGVLLIRGLRAPSDPRGHVFGLAIAGVIAAYTLVDKRGIEHATPIAYLELAMIAPTAVYAAGVGRRKGAAALRAEAGPAAVVAGLCTFGAYVLVLAALQRASAASVAAVRETSIVIAAALAALVLNERVGPERLAGAILVVAGVALLGL